ncbi:MAG TPA: CAP domain-containing protein [Bryobacteraceae bacterium]
MKFIARLLAIIITPLAAHASDLAEQVLAEINLARTAPQQYAQIVANQLAGYHGIEGDRAVNDAIHFLTKARPEAPLTFSPGMSNSALSHVLDVGPSGGRGHKGSNGSQPWDRMARFGKWIGRAGENIDYGVHDARAIVVRLIVDDGVSGRGHRKNIFNSDFHVAGAATGPHAAYGAMCVIDFATGFIPAAGTVATRGTVPASAL